MSTPIKLPRRKQRGSLLLHLPFFSDPVIVRALRLMASTGENSVASRTRGVFHPGCGLRTEEKAAMIDLRSPMKVATQARRAA